MGGEGDREVERLRVCVVDRSPTLGETIAIILGDRYTVHSVSPGDLATDPRLLGQPDLIILGPEPLPGAVRDAAPGGVPLLRVRALLPRVTGGHPDATHDYTPETLRAAVERLVAGEPGAPPPSHGAPALDYPFVPREAALVARAAADTAFPILLSGEAGTGTARLARAIHAVRQRGRLVTLSAAACSAATLEQAARLSPGPITLFVSDIADLGREAQLFLGDLVDSGGIRSEAGWHTVRLLCATETPLDRLPEHLGRDLFYRVAVFPLVLPPLRERLDDLPALATTLGNEVSRSLGRGPVEFTDRALARLQAYLWFGNLAEFETVITRSVALAATASIDAPDLLFGYGPVLPRVGANPPPARPAATPEPPQAAAVDLIINELAHEFKNPMVTIKTVAQHLGRLIEEEGGREQAARLTGEAVDRMDRALENLLQFTRFGPPAPETVALSALLAPGLSELAPVLAERKLTLAYDPPAQVFVYVDSGQVSYAIDNLLRVIVRDLGDGSTLTVRVSAAPATITFEFPTRHRSTSEKLADLLEHPTDSVGAAGALGMVFADTLIRRNRGSVRIQPGTPTSAVMVSLPGQEGRPRTHGTTTRTDR